MDKQMEAEFDRADRAIAKTASVVAAQINRLVDRPYVHVHHDYLVERLLLALLNDHDLAEILKPISTAGSAAIVLSNALLDYRDSRFEER